MADKALVVRDPVTLTRPDRTARIKSMMENIILNDMQNVRLAKYIHMDDAELLKVGFTERDIKKIREWEKPKKDAAMGMIAAHERVQAFIRKNDGEKRIELNVRNAIIQLPEKQDDAVPPVIIDVEPSK